jgi:hypothetical protein
MLFKDWRLLDQSSVGLVFDKKYFYYVHSRAWALKGWLGGTHSWFVFWSVEYDRWLVLELTDRETIDVQTATPLYMWIVKYTDHTPTISNRVPDAKWFGSTPIVVGKTLNNLTYQEIVDVCNSYPIKEFKLITHNCNTFASYVLYKLHLTIKRPLRSIGFKDTTWWKNYESQI